MWIVFQQWICIGFNADPDPGIQTKIQVSKPMRIHVDPVPDPEQSFKSQNAEFLH